MDRRTFLKGSAALATAGSVLGAASISDIRAAAQRPENIRNYHPEMRYRPYGLTGVGIWQLMQLFRAGMNLIGDEFRSQPTEIS